MSNVAVIMDVHGDLVALREVLSSIGAIDSQGNKQEGWHLIQLGDLVHRGHDRSTDFATLGYGLSVFDELLVGNHEFPDLGGPVFSGYDKDEPTASLLKKSFTTGRLKATTTVGPWLISHAGLHPWYWYVNYDCEENVQKLSTRINHDFVKRVISGQPNALFDSVGFTRSGGMDERMGGIFWCHLEELWEDYRDSGYKLPQIVGHTPVQSPFIAEGLLLSNDKGAGLSGMVGGFVSENNGNTWAAV